MPRAAFHDAGLTSLISPYGLISQVGTTTPLRGLDDLNCAFADAGAPWHHPGHQLKGTGVAIGDPGLARRVAIAEAAERLAGVDSGAEDYVWAEAAGLSGPVLDLARIPRCSESEYADPDCPLVPPDPGRLIRWSRGVELSTGSSIWVPSVMTIWGLPDRVRAENFWHSLSTGYAVHTDPAAALCAAICEVVERDVVEVLWAQMLPVPHLHPSHFSADCRRILDWCSAHFIEANLFDVTSDLAVPSVYCLLRAEHHPRLRNFVGCSTGVSLAAAADKVLLETLIFRQSLDAAAPRSQEDMARSASLTDGTLYMAAPERSSAFDFLAGGHHDRPPAPATCLPTDPGDRLRLLIARLAWRDVQVIAVDRTTDDLSRAGLHAYCVLIPDLQPMVVAPRGRYRGHGRLYAAPALMGYRSLPEEELNPWPQPFA
jgi:ribosomal protein S12 methylthiotransferase accessory factor